MRNNNAAWFEAHFSPLQRQADAWNTQGRSNGLMLRDEALLQAKQWAGEHDDGLLPVEQEFLTACREARRQVQRERRKNRFIQALAIVAVIISVVAGYFFFQAETKAQEAEQEKNNAETAKAEALQERDKAQQAEHEAERRAGVSLAQALNFQSIAQRQDDKKPILAGLLVRQAYLFNQRYKGRILAQIDKALRPVLEVFRLCCVSSVMT